MLAAIVIGTIMVATAAPQNQISLGQPSNLPSATTIGGAYVYRVGGTDVAFADGGTGLSAASDDTVLVSSGAAWQAKAVGDCDDVAGSHLNYDTTTNAFSCGNTGNISGVAAGYKVARGSTSFDGSNPTTVATGLATVVSCDEALRRGSSALSTGTAFATHDAPSGANVDFYEWTIAGTASTGTETFDWICVGT